MIYIAALIFLLPGAFESDDRIEPLAQPFAVVELFTSEGCSSCPPAETYLNELSKKGLERNVFALAFHVKYWDYLGWRDPYAQKGFAELQRAYAAKLERGRVYTPQMIVNGRHAFVGSDRNTGSLVIKRELKRPVTSAFKVNLRRKGGTLDLTYNAENYKNKNLNVALVAGGLESQVRAGENRGRLLKHENVVHWFASERLKATGTIEISIPKGLRKREFTLVAYLQDRNSLTIDNAAGFKLEP